MSQRTLVPIFVFWAFLTFITPTLILLSENSKADLDINGNATEGMKARRMIGYAQNHIHITRTPPSPAKSVVAEEELASAPAPAPAPSSGTRTSATTAWSHSHHNHTLRSNKTDDGLTLLPNKTHVKVKQTDIR